MNFRDYIAEEYVVRYLTEISYDPDTVKIVILTDEPRYIEYEVQCLLPSGNDKAGSTVTKVCKLYDDGGLYVWEFIDKRDLGSNKAVFNVQSNDMSPGIMTKVVDAAVKVAKDKKIKGFYYVGASDNKDFLDFVNYALGKDLGTQKVSLMFLGKTYITTKDFLLDLKERLEDKSKVFTMEQFASMKVNLYKAIRRVPDWKDLETKFDEIAVNNNQRARIYMRLFNKNPDVTAVSFDQALDYWYVEVRT